MSDPSLVAARLTELGVTPDIVTKIETELGAASVEDLGSLTESDLTGIGMKVLTARALIGKLKPAAAPAQPQQVTAVSFDAVLPAVPDGESWLSALKAGGVLKTETSTVIGLVRAALAHRVNLYEIPKELAAKMETFADTNEEPVGAEFFKVRKMVTKRAYGDIFEAIEGLDASFVTEERKRALLAKVDKLLWPAILAFHGSLTGWQQSWVQGAANPAMMMNAILAASGGGAGVMPPGMMAPPDTGVLRDAADAVNDACNKTLSATGVQVAGAMAAEAKRIVDLLSDSRMPAMIGVANREQLLREIKAAVQPTYPRLETNITRYVLSILKVKDVAAGSEELQYFSTLFMLGSNIPWEQVTAPSRGLGIGESGKPRDGKPGYGRGD